MQYRLYQMPGQAVKCKLTGHPWGGSILPGTLMPERGYQMTDTSTIPVEETETKSPVTLESLQESVNQIGGQLNWLCDNLAGLFSMVNQMGASGGGIMGMLSAMRGGTPAVQGETENTGE